MLGKYESLESWMQQEILILKEEVRILREEVTRLRSMLDDHVSTGRDDDEPPSAKEWFDNWKVVSGIFDDPVQSESGVGPSS